MLDRNLIEPDELTEELIRRTRTIVARSGRREHDGNGYFVRRFTLEHLTLELHPDTAEIPRSEVLIDDNKNDPDGVHPLLEEEGDKRWVLGEGEFLPEALEVIRRYMVLEDLADL